MAEYSCPITLVTPGPDIAFNTSTGDQYYLDPDRCSGLDQPAVRVTIDDKPQTAGAIVFPGFRGAMHIKLAGILLPATDTAAGRHTMEANFIAALDSIFAADGTLQQTPSGAALRSLTVRLEVPFVSSGYYRKYFEFGLVAAIPTWV